MQNSGPSSPQISTEKPKAFTTRLLLKDCEKEILLPVEKIEWIEAAEYYCCIHARTCQYMLRETISELADRLDPEQFVRIHRSTIVNVNHIKEIHREEADEATVSLLDGQNLKMSKAGLRRLLESGR